MTRSQARARAIAIWGVPVVVGDATTHWDVTVLDGSLHTLTVHGRPCCHACCRQLARERDASARREPLRTVTVTASLWNHQHGWLVRRKHRDGTGHPCAPNEKYWFADEEEALFIRRCLQQNLSIDDCRAALLAHVEAAQPTTDG